MTKAVLFDVDGTLLDTTEYIYQAFEYTLGTHGVPITREKMKKEMGKLLREMYKIFAPTHETELLAKTHHEYQKNTGHLAVPYPRVEETLSALRAAHVKLAAVTNRHKSSSHATLHSSDLMKFFDIVITADEVKNAKPHPEPFEKALAELHVNTEDAFAVGDTKNDVEAAKSAGIKVIAVSYGFQGDTISETSPDYLVHDIKDILPIIFST